MPQPAQTDFDHLWDYNDPAGTEMKFRALDAQSLSRSHRLQLQTQIARTLGLQRKSDDAHAMLDAMQAELEKADDPIAHTRYLLERGRAFNSSGKRDDARSLFVLASNLAQTNNLDFYAIDAMHMIAIVESGPIQQLDWNSKAIVLAEKSADERARGWLGSLYNNVGWTYFEQNRFDEALEIFQKALALRQSFGKIDLINIAHYCIAKTLRAMGRTDEAMKILATLKPDGYVSEEIGECLLASKQSEEARSHFRRAYESLSRDPWLKANEPARLERLRSLGGPS